MECSEEQRILSACVQYNGNTVPLPSPFSWPAMMDQAYDFEITDIYVQGLDGAPETASELLDFSVERTPRIGLEKICFEKWKPSVTAIEKEILEVLAEKAAISLKFLTVKIMIHASVQVREALADMVQKIILSNAPLETLDLNNAAFSEEAGEMICTALQKKVFSTLKIIHMSGHRSWFDTDEKCEAWERSFSN